MKELGNINKVRNKAKLINLCLFIIFLIIGFYTYVDNGKKIEPNIFSININHFSTFFGGSSFVLSILLFSMNIFKFNSTKLEIEFTSILIALLGTLWFTYDDEMNNKLNLQFDEIYGNILGFVFFLIINIGLYIFSYKTYNKT